jgi:diguanylate cyclase (GGDEF)-like protein
MSPWAFPIAVELVLSLVFCAVLYQLRRTLAGTGIALWLVIWAARASGSLLGMRLLSAAGNGPLALYVALQIFSAIGLAIIAVRLDHERRRLRAVNEELGRLRQEAADQLEIDALTGLLNRSALARWMDEGEEFVGQVVVCDMDDFKPLNDYYGHLVGDEILHGVGKLIRSSIREQDLAFRWGGDEFVIFFRNEDPDLVTNRMRSLEERLEGFHVRSQEPVPVRFSWGVAPTTGRPLRQSLAEADRAMYAAKRTRRVAEPPLS